MGAVHAAYRLGDNHRVDLEKLHAINNFLAVSDDMATAGQPTAEQFSLIALAGFQAVINLAMPDSDGALDDEADVVQLSNMHYAHIPVMWNAPSIADVEKFFAALDKHQGQKIFVHCAANKRTAVFVFLYRVIKIQQPCTEVFSDVMKIWTPDVPWTNFIEQALNHYDAQGSAQAKGSARGRKPEAAKFGNH